MVTLASMTPPAYQRPSRNPTALFDVPLIVVGRVEQKGRP